MAYRADFWGSIVWIAAICYFMVEWSVEVAEMVQVRWRANLLLAALLHAPCSLLLAGFQ